ncbi:MAG: ParB/RepB/Spo0J family partition protein [Bifidobacterium sp.]|jgi:ParB family chromosome partitioning protein|nr:ParB/RepB/Spo0J family partition protein [Bifidobacterium sp.]
MATKSRLGKGLGALFPDLPGEPLSLSANEDEQSVAQAVVDDSAADHAVANSNSYESAEQPEVSTDPAAADRTHQADPKGKLSTRHKHPAKHDVSRETSKSTGKKRVSVPTLSEIVHPSDVFFGATGDITTARRRNESVQDDAMDARQVSPNSRETANVGAEFISHDDEIASSETELAPVQGGYLAEIKVSDVGPNLHQPRTVFDEDELKELADSIQEVGVLQPIVVRKRPQNQQPENNTKSSGPGASLARTNRIEHVKAGIATHDETHNVPSSASDVSASPAMDSVYELIMGERRWRASQLAGLETIPAIVKTTADDDMLRDALLENLHRVNLNPLEEAAAFQQMIKEFGLTQAELSRAISKSRPQIANTLRLLNLPGSVQKKVAAGVLSAGHARALLSLPTQAEMDKLATRIIAEGLSVRSTEEIVAISSASADQPAKAKAPKKNPWLDSPIQRNLENHLDTKVSIKGNHKHGRIEIVFSSPEDMDRIVDLLMPNTGAAANSVTAHTEWV